MTSLSKIDVVGPTDIAAPPERGRLSASERRVIWIALVAALVIVRILAVGEIVAEPHASSAYRYDAKRYHHIATDQGIGYRDFPVEFPPVSYLFIEGVQGAAVDDTLRHLGIAGLVLDLAAAAAVFWGFGRRECLAYLVLGLPFLYIPYVYFRVDLLSVALAMWGLALVRRRWDRTGGVLLALAVLAKLWPLALVPLLIVQRRWRAAGATVLTGIGCVAAWIAVAGVDGIRQVFTFRGATGWQIESLVGGTARLFTGEYPRQESGALRAGDSSLAVSILLGLVILAVGAWTWWRLYRATDPSTALLYGVAPLTVVTTFMVCSPVLSPQYLIWLVPFAAIAWVGGQRLCAGLAGAAILVTNLLLINLYGSLNRAETAGQLVLTVRNGLLLGVVAAGLIAVSKAKRAPSADPLEIAWNR